MNPALYVLRGISQIFFVSHALCGLLLTATMAVFDLRFAGLVLTGCASSTLIAWLLCDKELVRAGVVGFNGALFAAIATVYSGFTLRTLAFAIVGGGITAVLFALYERLFQSPWLRGLNLAVASAPFATVATALFGATGVMQSEWDLTTASGAEGFVLAVGNSIAEVFFIDGLLFGLVIVACVIPFDRRVAGFIVFGAIVGSAGASLWHGIPTASTGLFTYCTVLVSVAIGAVFLPTMSLFARVGLAFAGCMLVLIIQPILALTGLPVAAWPFLSSLWIIMGVSSVMRQRREPRTPQEVQAEPPVPHHSVIEEGQ